MTTNKEKSCIEVFGLLWENPSNGMWYFKGTYLPMKVRILNNGLFTYSLGSDEEVGEYPTMAKACTVATLKMVERLQGQIDTLKDSLKLVDNQMIRIQQLGRQLET